MNAASTYVACRRREHHRDGRASLIAPADVRDVDSVEAVVERTVEEFGGVTGDSMTADE